MGGRHRGDFPAKIAAPFIVDHRDGPVAARPPLRDDIREAWTDLTPPERKRLANLQPTLVRAIVTHLDQKDTP